MKQLSASEQVVSPWVTLVARTVVSDEDAVPRTFHSLKQADYVSVLAVTADGRIPVVRQYRPTAEGLTLELPAGLLEPDETPELCAHRELAEECGLALPPGGRLVPLPLMRPDTGRLENRLWSFFADGCEPIADWRPEPGVAVEFFAAAEFWRAMAAGTFDHALHVAVVGQAVLAGLIAPPAHPPERNL